MKKQVLVGLILVSGFSANVFGAGLVCNITESEAALSNSTSQSSSSYQSTLMVQSNSEMASTRFSSRLFSGVQIKLSACTNCTSIGTDKQNEILVQIEDTKSDVASDYIALGDSLLGTFKLNKAASITFNCRFAE